MTLLKMQIEYEGFQAQINKLNDDITKLIERRGKLYRKIQDETLAEFGLFLGTLVDVTQAMHEHFYAETPQHDYDNWIDRPFEVGVRATVDRVDIQNKTIALRHKTWVMTMPYEFFNRVSEAGNGND